LSPLPDQYPVFKHGLIYILLKLNAIFIIFVINIDTFDSSWKDIVNPDLVKYRIRVKKMVVVTGASGHVGGNLVRALLSRGRSVRAMIHRDRRAIQGLDVEQVQGDIREPGSLRRAFQGAEVVYHAAAYISLLDDWPRLEAVNVLGTRNVVQACIACDVKRLVHFSSIHALEQKPFDLPVNEDSPFVGSRRDPPYDRSKAAGEKEVLNGIEQGLDAVIINPTGIIGPDDFKPSHSGQVLLAMAMGKLPALVGGGFDWVDIRDVVDGSLRAEEVASSGSRYLLSGHWVSVRDMADQVQKITGVRSPWFVSPMWLARVAAPFATAYALWRGRSPLCRGWM
jgi:dihydroflavonol-4-reductase